MRSTIDCSRDSVSLVRMMAGWQICRLELSIQLLNQPVSYPAGGSVRRFVICTRSRSRVRSCRLDLLWILLLHVKVMQTRDSCLTRKSAGSTHSAASYSNTNVRPMRVWSVLARTSNAIMPPSYSRLLCGFSTHLAELSACDLSLRRCVTPKRRCVYFLAFLAQSLAVDFEKDFQLRHRVAFSAEVDNAGGSHARRLVPPGLKRKVQKCRISVWSFLLLAQAEIPAALALGLVL
jgi:hypothetical protein